MLRTRAGASARDGRGLRGLHLSLERAHLLLQLRHLLVELVHVREERVVAVVRGLEPLDQLVNLLHATHAAVAPPPPFKTAAAGPTPSRGWHECIAQLADWCTTRVRCALPCHARDLMPNVHSKM